ncbi:MAG: hypothetical protein R3B96_16255 [Pirellulaceae bacterium]
MAPQDGLRCCLTIGFASTAWIIWKIKLAGDDLGVDVARVLRSIDHLAEAASVGAGQESWSVQPRFQ